MKRRRRPLPSQWLAWGLQDTSGYVIPWTWRTRALARRAAGTCGPYFENGARVVRVLVKILPAKRRARS